MTHLIKKTIYFICLSTIVFANQINNDKFIFYKAFSMCEDSTVKTDIYAYTDKEANQIYKDKTIHPGCLYQLLPELNGDNIVKKIDLINCAESNKYYTKTIDNKEYLGALVDNGETYTQYHLIKYLGYGLYEFNIISYPAKEGTIVSKDKVIVKLNREIFYEYISVGEDNENTIDKKNYLELQLLLNTIDNNDTQLNQKYENIKQIIINQYKNMDNNSK